MKKTITTAAIAAMVLSASVAMAADPVCGDVTDDGSIKTTDALLVLKKAVAQPITLDCSAYDDQFSACETSLAGANANLLTCNSDLSTTNADLGTCAGDLATCEAAPVCGDGLVAGDEDCDVGNLNGETCVTQGFAGGTLACSFCAFDTSDCYATRFDASGDTVIDHETGLEWEKKNAAGGEFSVCPGGSTCANPHDVDKFYQWSSTETAPDGGAFTDFLDKLNGGEYNGCYAGHCDWRLPTIEELQSIVDLSASDCGSGGTCIDPAFGPTQSSTYWSSTTYQDTPSGAWLVYFSYGSTDTNDKTDGHYVRAVRAGS